MSFEDGVRAGYLAAIIEGEGSISLIRGIHKRRGGKANVFYTAQVQLNNNSYELLEAVKDWIGGGHIAKVSKDCRCYYFCLRKQIKLFRCLMDIEPHLLSDRKRRLCELLMEFCGLRLEKLESGEKGKYAYGEREVEIWQEMRDLNAS